MDVPKNGPAHAVTDEWKEALKRRLEEMGWTYTDLAKQVGVTTAAISHLMKNGVQSSMVPEIEATVGWTKESATWPEGTQGADPGSRQKLVMHALEGMFSSPDQLELNSYFQVLKPENRARVLERAKMLYEEEERDRQQIKVKRP